MPFRGLTVGLSAAGGAESSVKTTKIHLLSPSKTPSKTHGSFKRKVAWTSHAHTSNGNSPLGLAVFSTHSNKKQKKQTPRASAINIESLKYLQVKEMIKSQTEELQRLGISTSNSDDHLQTIPMQAVSVDLDEDEVDRIASSCDEKSVHHYARYRPKRSAAPDAEMMIVGKRIHSPDMHRERTYITPSFSGVPPLNLSKIPSIVSPRSDTSDTVSGLSSPDRSRSTRHRLGSSVWTPWRKRETHTHKRNLKVSNI